MEKHDESSLLRTHHAFYNGSPAIILLYSLKIDRRANSMLSVVNNKTEFLWLSYNQINKLFNEKKLNIDQLSCITKCYE